MFNQLSLSAMIKKAVFLFCAAPLVVMAQEWPNKPITFIVPFPAGGVQTHLLDLWQPS